MSFWVVIDDSVAADELLAGAGAAAIGALAAVITADLASGQLRIRVRWLVHSLRLPWRLLRDTFVIFAALWDFLARGQRPRSAFREQPARYGPDTAAGSTRRSLLVGGLSVAPNMFVLGMDRDRDVMVVHELVQPGRETGR